MTSQFPTLSPARLPQDQEPPDGELPDSSSTGISQDFLANPENAKAVPVAPDFAIDFPERKDVTQMYKNIRSWALFSLIIGIVSIFANTSLDPVWGIMLCLVALLSWRIKIPGMFVIYSVVMGWAALMNGISILMGGQVYWLILSFLQAYWTISIVIQYRKYRKLRLAELYRAGKWPENLKPPQNEVKISRNLSIVGAVLAVFCLIFLPATCVGIILLSAIAEASLPEGLLSLLLSGIVNIAVLAFAMSCAALLTMKNNRGLAISAVVASALVLAGWLVFLLITNLIPDGGGFPSA